MKKITLWLTVLINSPLFVNPALAKTQGNWNPITIYNHTNTAIAYVISGTYGGTVYGINRGGTDIYHSGFGDEYAVVQVGVCNEVVGDGCRSFGNLRTCTNAHYNADHIRSIEITSLSSCIVTCLDGGGTSCKQNG